MSWRSARPRTATLRGQPRQKFATSRSRSAESLSSQQSSGKQSKDDIKAQLAKWQGEAKAKKSVADRTQAKKQHAAALLDFQYCVGNECSRAVQKFCSANQLSAPESVDLMKFVRYAKEKGLVQSSEDAKTLCSVWASKSL